MHSQNARPVLDKVGSFQALISVETLGDYGVIRSAERDRQGKVMELYEAWHLSLFRYLRTLGLHRERAEDVVQETFLRLTGHLARGGAETNLRSWIFQVAFNLTMDGHRVDRRERVQSDGPEFIPIEPADPHADPERTYLEKEAMERVEVGLTKLTTQQRNGVLLRAQGLRYMEIGSMLGVSESRAIHLVKRGLERLTGDL